MTGAMHRWDERTDLLAHSILGYAVERLELRMDPRWGAHPADELNAVLRDTITPEGIGGHEALRLFRDELLPACRPMDHPMNLAYVPTAPTHAATMFDLVVSACSVFAGYWEAGSGAIAAENRALRWLADLADFPPEAGGCFVTGGSAANLSALVAARVRAAATRQPERRWRFATTSEAHASVRAAARVMDADIALVPADAKGRMTGAALRSVVDADGADLFAVVATAGTTNAGAIDELHAIADVCAEHDLWLHVDGAYGLAAMCAPSLRPAFRGIERADSFGVDPHKWLFAPYDCAALVYRDPSHAATAHAQHGAYIDAVDHGEWNPSDYAYHLSRRARGLPLWFSLATHGTRAYSEAIETTLEVTRGIADAIRRRPDFELLIEPDLSILLFRRRGWQADDYLRWSRANARAGIALMVPTTWAGEPCMRICIVNPLTEVDEVVKVIDTM